MGKILAGSLDLQQLAATPGSPPAAGYNKFYVKSDGFAYMLDSAGVETRVPVGGTKVSALPAVTTPAGTDEIPMNQGGVSKKITLTQINSYIEPISSASTAAQVLTSGEVLIAGSSITMNPARLQAGSFYRCRFNIVKTAAGVIAPVMNIRLGTTGTSADASVATLTFGAQTAVADEGEIEFLANFRSIGSGTAALLGYYAKMSHKFVTTGLSTTATNMLLTGASVGFDSTTKTKMGLYLNVGTAASWTVNVVQADLLNIA